MFAHELINAESERLVPRRFIYTSYSVSTGSSGNMRETETVFILRLTTTHYYSVRVHGRLIRYTRVVSRVISLEDDTAAE